jgi:hypothetical protein
MEIKFQGQYEKKDFFRAVRIANQPPKNQIRFLWLMIAFSVVALVMLFYRIYQTKDLIGNAILLLATMLIFGVISWIVLRPFFTARKLWSDPGVQRFLKGKITNHAVIYHLKEGNNEIRWDQFSRVRKIDELVTLVRRDGLMLVFPKSFFQRESDWRKFSHLVEKKFTM